MIVFISLSKKNEEVTKVRSVLSDYEINPKYVFESLESVASENEIQDLFFKTKILFVHADFLSKREYDFIGEFHSAKKILFLGMINEMVFNIPNLYRVFTNNFQDVPLSHKPIFFEYLTFPAIEQLAITKTKNAKILSNSISIGYIPSNSFYSLIQIIRFFNLHPKFRFNIYLNYSDYESLLKNISNENILFSDYCVDNLIKGNHDIFISSGPGISDLLFLERPILIVGSKGYGGLLSMKNFNQHIDCDFSGRIGGDENEPIPEQLLIKDIDECLKLYDEAPATGYNLFKYCLPIVKNKLAIKLRPIEVLVSTRIYNNFTSAVPLMDKAVKLVKLGSKSDEYALLNGFNKIVLRLNNEDIKCLRYINGKNSFDDICTMTGVSDKSQIYHFLDKLIDYKLADFV